MARGRLGSWWEPRSGPAQSQGQRTVRLDPEVRRPTKATRTVACCSWRSPCRWRCCTVAQGSASAVAIPAALPATVLAGRDFATATFGDPWDYSNAADLVLDGGPALGLTRPSMSGGMVNFFTHAGYVSPMWGGYATEVPVEREGTRAGNSLDARTYTRMHLHIYVLRPAPVAALILVHLWRATQCP